jgi:hypothetical protein
VVDAELEVAPREGAGFDGAARGALEGGDHESLRRL